jgi:glycosyltransferase involved in cell wall biosynthesis
MEYVYSQQSLSDINYTAIFTNNYLVELHKTSMETLGIAYEICADSSSALLKAIVYQLLNGDYDLIHSHGYTSGSLAAIPARLFRIPHIMTIHDVLQNNQFMGTRGYLKKRLLPKLFNCIDILNPVSHDVENNLIEMLPSLASKRIATIHNGIDVQKFSSPDKRDLHKELGLDKNIFLVGFLGRFMSQKGFRHLVEAVDILLRRGNPPRDFRIIAVGSGGFIREDAELIRSKGMADSFVFLPAVSSSAATMMGMNAIVIPSLWEACPLLPMEALVLGVPVIASDCIGLREVIKGSPTFTVRAGDSTDLSGALNQVMMNDRRLEFQAYRELARERFDSKRTAGNLSELYKRLIC